MSDDVFHSVDFSEFEIGKLTERNLFLYFPSNERYLLICNALHPIEERALKKIRKLGNVFSDKPSMAERFKKMGEILFNMREITTEDNDAPFEVNRKILEYTSPLAEMIFNDEGVFDVAPIVMFMHECFESPSKNILLFIEEESTEVFEKAIIRSTLSGLIALWVGYHPKKFIQKWMEIVFCESVAEAKALYSFKQENSVELIRSGAVPNYKPEIDGRFEMMLSEKAPSSGYSEDSLAILQYTDGLIAKEKEMEKESSHRGRIARLIQAKLAAHKARKESKKTKKEKAEEAKAA